MRDERLLRKDVGAFDFTNGCQLLPQPRQLLVRVLARRCEQRPADSKQWALGASPERGLESGSDGRVQRVGVLGEVVIESRRVGPHVVADARGLENARGSPRTKLRPLCMGEYI